MEFKTLIIDAGHGINTQGKRTPDGIHEWSLNNAVATKLTKMLDGYNVKISRTDDFTGQVDVALSKRSSIIRQQNPNMMISIHHNANTGNWGNWGGFEVLYMQDDESFADRSVPYFDKYLGIAVNGKKIVRHGDPSKMQDLHILREIPKGVLACLVEIGFMDSNNDYHYITSNEGQENAAKALFEFVVKELNLTKIEVKPRYVSILEKCNLSNLQEWIDAIEIERKLNNGLLKYIPELIEKVYAETTFEQILVGTVGLSNGYEWIKCVEECKKRTDVLRYIDSLIVKVALAE